jgi:hypothetical protein
MLLKSDDFQAINIKLIHKHFHARVQFITFNKTNPQKRKQMKLIMGSGWLGWVGLVETRVLGQLMIEM